MRVPFTELINSLKKDSGVTASDDSSPDDRPESFFRLFINSVNGTLIEWFYTKDENDLVTGMNNIKNLIQIYLK